MPNFYSDDEDCPDCGSMFLCAFHAEPGKRAQEARRAEMRDRGIDPDAEVSGELASIWLALSMANCLSQNQKDAIERILFPYPRR